MLRLGTSQEALLKTMHNGTSVQFVPDASFCWLEFRFPQNRRPELILDALAKLGWIEDEAESTYSVLVMEKQGSGPAGDWTKKEHRSFLTETRRLLRTLYITEVPCPPSKKVPWVIS